MILKVTATGAAFVVTTVGVKEAIDFSIKPACPVTQCVGIPQPETWGMPHAERENQSPGPMRATWEFVSSGSTAANSLMLGPVLRYLPGATRVYIQVDVRNPLNTKLRDA